MENSFLFRWYFAIFQFISRVRAEKNDLDLRIIHTHLTTVLTTGVLMWTYALLALNAFSTPVPGLVGISCSFIHLLSPLLFLITARSAIVCSVTLGAGIVHQLTFAYFSGGVESAILMWLPILPLLAGYIEGRRSLLLWTFISAGAAGVFIGIHFMGHEFPRLITRDGYELSKALLYFGWLFIIFITTWVHVAMRDHSEMVLKKEREKIDDLFRVLFHDLANSLGRISIGVGLAERQENPPGTARGLQVIRDAQVTMTEITQNMRRMYAASKGKSDVELVPCPLNDCVSHLRKMFSGVLEEKRLQLDFDPEKHRDFHVVVDQVSFNHQVLANVLSNAIKFSQPGGVVSVSGKRISSDLVAVEIRDAGIGMSPDQVRGIFDLNRRTSRPGTQGEIGTGFGMHIMRTFVEMYGGTVEIESSMPGGETPAGTCVRIILRGSWKS